jgi:hypothetical protein
MMRIHCGPEHLQRNCHHWQTVSQASRCQVLTSFLHFGTVRIWLSWLAGIIMCRAMCSHESSGMPGVPLTTVSKLNPRLYAQAANHECASDTRVLNTRKWYSERFHGVILMMQFLTHSGEL